MSAWADNPQAAEIDALIERAARLTHSEIDNLETAQRAARVAAQSAAWDAAQGAAWVAARGAAQSAARGAARVAAWGAAWGAARLGARRGVRRAAWDAGDAVDALLVRDLIDEATDWNQAAYDLLTAPWVAVIGPVHPDDTVRP